MKLIINNIIMGKKMEMVKGIFSLVPKIFKLNIDKNRIIKDLFFIKFYYRDKIDYC